MRLRRKLPPGTAHAVRIALATSLLIGVVYAGCVTVLDRVVAARLTAAVDARLQERLSDVRESGAATASKSKSEAGDDDDDDDSDAPPMYLWLVTPGGIERVSAGAPQLPRGTTLAGDPEALVLHVVQAQSQAQYEAGLGEGEAEEAAEGAEAPAATEGE